MGERKSVACESRFSINPVAVTLPSLTSIAHQLWRALPREPRRRLLYGAIDALAPAASPAARLRPGPLIIGGVLSTASGLGESARLCLDAVRALGWNAGHADLSSLFLRSDLLQPIPGPAAVAGEGGTMILHINGPHMPYVAFRLGRTFMAGRRIIGYWAWELPRMGPDWRRGLRHVHEIWVPSQFTADSLPPGVNVPVRVVPHPVQSSGQPDRGRFGILAGTFTVLTAFDMGSTYVRKNPRAAVEAFRRAFGDAPDCLLLLKVGHASDAGWAMDDLQDAIAGMSNVRLIEATLSRAEMAALVASADVVLSLHRAEGFGLLLAEAMLSGVPVVATGWSGNLDFMSPDDSALVGYRLIPVDDPQGTYAVPDSQWAEPVVDEAAAWLRRLFTDKALRLGMGARGRAAAMEKLSLTTYKRAIGDSLPPP
jgi:glycosyltransferase involved in cell wall biosynthesis